MPAKSIPAIAREKFGFKQLRPGQREAILQIRRGGDCLVVMPTGAGKSAIYQVGGLLLPGITVVISPLIALQKDQVDSINASEAPEAVQINSSLRVKQARENIAKIEGGESKYVFIAPEQLHREETIVPLRSAGVSLFVVDEAHCISEWGHDFRPDYLQLGAAVEALGRPPVLAMTATASKRVRKEIIQRLGMRKPKVIVRGFDRPNISLRVNRYEKESEKLDALVRQVNWAEKPGIVYVATRKHTEDVKAALDGVRAERYHGGLKADERTAIQEKFMAGDLDVVVATNAFGMGIDKPNVRFVFHYDISDSLDSYYQEIGRGGRDGERAEAILFYRPEDIGVRKFLSGEGELEQQDFEKVIEAAGDGADVKSISEEAEISERKAQSMLHRLEEVGAVEVSTDGEVRAAGQVEVEEAARAAAEQQRLHKEGRAERLRLMQDYADTSQCRRELLLQYLGDDFEGPCGNCDNCLNASTGDIPVDPSVGTRREVA